MTMQLVLVHGRAQEGKDSVELKREWIAALKRGFEAAELELPIAEADIRFPYYGDTLDELRRGVEPVTPVVVRGEGTDGEEEAYLFEILSELQEKVGVSDATVREEFGPQPIHRGVLNHEWVLAVLRALDRKLPGMSAFGIWTATRDVYRYLEHGGVRDTLEEGVREAIMPGVPTVVIGHSLGSVVAYNLLRRDGEKLGWKVPLFMTLGSPLGVTEIRKRLRPLKYPACVGHWINALDLRDVVALYPLDASRFKVERPIENWTDLINDTHNRHGIEGYLSDSVVARRIHAALTTGS